MPKQKQTTHIPVLSDEVIEYLNPQKGERYLDLTAGYGGHASKILSLTNYQATLVDRDINAIKVLQSKFKDKQVNIVHGDFLNVSKQLAAHKEKYDMILADLGVSSPHLDKASRGFSIQKDGPLDMRMDQSQQLSALDVVNTYNERQLQEILSRYGEEPKARRIAQLIVESRPVKTTHELANIVKMAWTGYSRSHPATRTFQAIRIAVNDELSQLEESMQIWLELLAPGGRMAIISFHSLEDSLVKRFFKEFGGNTYDAILNVLTKRPVQASSPELVYNPRARSARLRVAAKIKTKRKGT